MENTEGVKAWFNKLTMAIYFIYINLPSSSPPHPLHILLTLLRPPCPLWWIEKKVSSFARLNLKCFIFAYHGKIWVTYIGMRFRFAYHATFFDLSSRKPAWKTIYDWLWRGSTNAVTSFATEIFPIESYLHLSSTWWPLFRIIGADLYIRIIGKNSRFAYSFSTRTGRTVCTDACFLL